MIAVGIRELKNRLSAYIRRVRDGEEILVTDRGVVVAEIRQPGRAVPAIYPGLADLAHRGKARLGADNSAEVYPRLDPVLREGEAARLLDRERGER
jgi:antitoxin (DNA-binding transcriptional repressor) of toxin-antitoxin stability system